jgi:hypothetical protein
VNVNEPTPTYQSMVTQLTLKRWSRRLRALPGRAARKLLRTLGSAR